MSIGIWNNIDELALYLGLKRLDGETNDELLNRIKLFPKWKYKTDYLTQVHSIPLQTGLNTYILGRIINLNGNNFECNVDWDYFTLREVLSDGTTGEFIRVFLEGRDENKQPDKVSSIVSAINSTTAFSFVQYKDTNIQNKFLVRNKNVKTVKEKINSSYTRLDNKNIVPGSFRADHRSFRKRVASVDLLKMPGEYFVDHSEGYVQTFDKTITETTVVYKYYGRSFVLEATELNLIPMNRLFAYGLSDEAIKVIPFLLSSIVAGE